MRITKVNFNFSASSDYYRNFYIYIYITLRTKEISNMLISLLSNTAISLHTAKKKRRVKAA